MTRKTPNPFVALCGAYIVVATAAFPGWCQGAQPFSSADAKRGVFLAGGDESALQNRVRCAVETIDGRPYWVIAPDRDPYSKVEWEFEIPLSDAGVVELVFYDRGAGVIEPRMSGGEAPWTVPVRQGSYTRLNTETERSAYFAFRDVPSGLAALRVAGLQYLGAINVYPSFTEADWEAVSKSVPTDVRPIVELTRSMELVTTAGIDVRGGVEALESSLTAMHELAPLAKVLGFTSVESYVTWKRIEPEQGQFDFSFYDAIVEKLGQYDLKWFPLLIVGSAYALPDWFLYSDENVGFECLEHGVPNDIQSIWSPYHKPHVERVLNAFGEHYDGTGVLEGVRLGPSGNYGESQYPAGGHWPSAREGDMHIHIGYWAGDPYARADFRKWVETKYESVERLNDAWNADFASFDDVEVVLPQLILNRRQRIDTSEWYTDSMSDWCAWWAGVSREALPSTTMYQSAGGWGFRESGTDYTAQTKAMAPLDAGIRLTNETDSYEQDFYATRLAATAARLYGVPLGFEPASSHTARGVAGRLFNTISTNGDHFFTYHSNVFNHQMNIDSWLEHLPLLDSRQDPLVEVAVYYPETMNQLEDAAFRHLYAWGFNPRAREVRRQVDVDYLDERLIREGFLDRYKTLVFAWGDTIEADVQAKIDAWIQRGGVALYPSFPKGDQMTVEGDRSVFRKWMRGETGRGAFRRFPGDMEPPSLYGDWVGGRLRELDNLDKLTQLALETIHPEHVFITIQNDGHFLILNYEDLAATVELPGHFEEIVDPYSILRVEVDPNPIRVARTK